MTTSPAYHPLATQHEALLRAVAERVKETAAIESLYLLGLTHTEHRTESLFAALPITQPGVTHCWLLAIAEQSQDVNNLPDSLETRLLPLVPSTVIVLSAVAFRQWLAEGHPFAAAVYRNGYVLYRADGAALPTPPAVDEEGRRREAEGLFIQTGQRVREFLAGAELYALRMHYGLAAFLLHQATEQCFRTLLAVRTGLRLNTHNLYRLLRHCTMFCPGLARLFPVVGEKEKRLFALLQTAYVQARYGENFRPKREEITALTEKVKEVQEIFERHQPQPTL